MVCFEFIPVETERMSDTKVPTFQKCSKARRIIFRCSKQIIQGPREQMSRGIVGMLFLEEGPCNILGTATGGISLDDTLSKSQRRGYSGRVAEMEGNQA